MNAPQPTEFVYDWYEPEASYEEGHWVQYRILKRTKEFVFVDYRVGGWLSKHPSREVRKLRRAELEEEGSVWWRGSRTWGERYYTEAKKNELEEARRLRYLNNIPECLKALGLTKEATAKDVTRAYRNLCLKEHPDKGGTHEGFLLLKQYYETALRMVQS